MDIRLKIFELRSYTPIPFIAVMLVYAGPTVTSLITGLLIAVLGEAIRFWGVSIVGSETRTTGVVGATNLITDGPFGFVRNPLYVGNILMYVGCGVMSNALVPWLQLVALVWFVIQYHLIVSREEEHLLQTFGDEYARYVKNVPRFIPRLTKYTGDHSFHRDPNFSRGIQSETRTLQGFFAVILLIIARYFFG
ncbi:MAG: isoprenylcysteine carboxylmethyltransferase family protein [Ignavibacteriales bacterium]|nr:isoprenylcysteine carboxylmethyltransferase family protein [Ignavibacteriales bacterium]